MSDEKHLGRLVGRGRTADIYAWDGDRVVKLFHDWVSVSGVEHEAQAGRLVHAAGLPAPRLDEVVSVEGRRGIVYERLQGPSMLTLIERQLWSVRRFARQMAGLHAAMHAVRLGDLPSQREYLRRKIEHADLLPDRARAAALAALERLPDDDAVCHGDFHPDNILITARGPVIIDWHDTMRGHPLGDVARTLLLLSVGEPPGVFAPLRWIVGRFRSTLSDAYLRQYGTLTGVARAEIDAWMLPVTAGRLSERIPGEVDSLLARVEALLAD
jgi:aminoglycoside phosphotransferase (APT) family kinase protein